MNSESQARFEASLSRARRAIWEAVKIADLADKTAAADELMQMSDTLFHMLEAEIKSSGKLRTRVRHQAG